MIIDNITNDKLERFFDSLTPQVAMQLIQLIEYGRQNGKDDPIFDSIMLHARSVLRDAGLNIDRLPTVKRVFCKPFQELLVTGRQFEKYKGQINRSSIKPIWEWLHSSLLPEELPRLSIMLEQALQTGDIKQAKALREELYTLTTTALRDAIKTAEDSDGQKEKRLLGMQLGNECVLEDAYEIAITLSMATDLSELKKQLPDAITELDGEVLSYCVQLYRKFIEKNPDHPEIFLAILKSRLKYQGQIMRLAKKMLLKEDDASICASPHGAGGEMLLAGMELIVHEINEAVRLHEPAKDILFRMKLFHKLAKEFTSEVRINMKGPWGKRLVEARKLIAELIEREISPVQRLIREALLGRGSIMKSRQKQGGSTELNPESLLEAERGLRILIGSRFLGEQLSLGVKINQYVKDNKQYLDQITERNIALIKSKSAEESEKALKSLKVSLSLIRIVQGDEMAELIWRRGQAAQAMLEQEVSEA